MHPFKVWGKFATDKNDTDSTSGQSLRGHWGSAIIGQTRLGDRRCREERMNGGLGLRNLKDAHYALFAAVLRSTIMNVSKYGDVPDVKRAFPPPATAQDMMNMSRELSMVPGAGQM